MHAEDTTCIQASRGLQCLNTAAALHIFTLTLFIYVPYSQGLHHWRSFGLAWVLQGFWTGQLHVYWRSALAERLERHCL
jgi:hypothetical protein